MTFDIRDTRPEDIDTFVSNMAQDDKDELVYGWNKTADELLRTALTVCNELHSVWDGDSIIIIYGCTSEGHLFLMKTPGIEKFALPLCYAMRKGLYSLMWKYGGLKMWLNKRHNKLVRYLRWLGGRELELERGFMQFEFHTEDFKE